jgi:hypothetical protein
MQHLMILALGVGQTLRWRWYKSAYGAGGEYTPWGWVLTLNLMPCMQHLIILALVGACPKSLTT